ncbi:hypothetical protein C8034_v003880 [Colletotrichum sidae]|uniref:Uncharacterized protein n=1 Tax=Colletotrichum sidae TaxID=1347389 RepID=A0A4R8TNZ1_9PEZI|nr:hypothetical protein C8034_v003880 [Colletotrichum sidae]
MTSRGESHARDRSNVEAADAEKARTEEKVRNAAEARFVVFHAEDDDEHDIASIFPKVTNFREKAPRPTSISDHSAKLPLPKKGILVDVRTHIERAQDAWQDARLDQIDDWPKLVSPPDTLRWVYSETDVVAVFNRHPLAIVNEIVKRIDEHTPTPSEDDQYMLVQYLEEQTSISHDILVEKLMEKTNQDAGMRTCPLITRPDGTMLTTIKEGDKNWPDLEGGRTGARSRAVVVFEYKRFGVVHDCINNLKDLCREIGDHTAKGRLDDPDAKWDLGSKRIIQQDLCYALAHRVRDAVTSDVKSTFHARFPTIDYASTGEEAWKQHVDEVELTFIDKHSDVPRALVGIITKAMREVRPIMVGQYKTRVTAREAEALAEHGLSKDDDEEGLNWDEVIS